MSRTVTLRDKAVGTATITGPWRDFGDSREGKAILDCDAPTAGISPTLDVVIETSDDTSDSAETATAATFTQQTTAMGARQHQRQLEGLLRYMRYRATIAPAGAFATLATALTGTNNDLTYTAVTRGVAGNAITVAYVDPGGVTSTLSVAVVGSAITVTLGRAGSAIVSTAAQVRTAVLANAAAAALVGVVNTGGNDGTGVVTALAPTNLATGVDPGTFNYGIKVELAED